MPKPHIALLGPGKWGRKILQTLSQIGPKITVVHRGDPEIINFLKTNYPDLNHTIDLNSVLNDKTVSAVFISTPIDTHETLVEASLKADKHVFVEKPLSVDLGNIEALYDLAHEKNRVLFTGYLYLYDPAFLKLKEVLRETKAAINMNWNKWGTFDDPLETNLLVHEVALSVALLGRVHDLNVIKKEAHSIVLELELERGLTTININRYTKDKQKSLIVKTKNDQIFNLEGQILTQKKDGAEIMLVNKSEEQILTAELESFLAEVTSGQNQNYKRQMIDLQVANVLKKLS